MQSNYDEKICRVCEGCIKYDNECLSAATVVQLFLDGALVPGWEGKIVAWVEEDHGEDR